MSVELTGAFLKPFLENWPRDPHICPTALTLWLTKCTVRLKSGYLVKVHKSFLKKASTKSKAVTWTQKINTRKGLLQVVTSIFSVIVLGMRICSIIVPRLAGANVAASEAKQTKNKRTIRNTSNRTVMCLGGFFGYEPTFCIFDGYFYMGFWSARNASTSYSISFNRKSFAQCWSQHHPLLYLRLWSKGLDSNGKGEGGGD
jgi:hypothetical protein